MFIQTVFCPYLRMTMTMMMKIRRMTKRIATTMIPISPGMSFVLFLVTSTKMINSSQAMYFLKNNDRSDLSYLSGSEVRCTLPYIRPGTSRSRGHIRPGTFRSRGHIRPGTSRSKGHIPLHPMSNSSRYKGCCSCIHKNQQGRLNKIIHESSLVSLTSATAESLWISQMCMM